MYLIILALIGLIVGYFIPMSFGIGLSLFLIIIILYNFIIAKGKELDGFGNLIIIGVLDSFLIELCFGKGIDHNFNSMTNTKNELSTITSNINNNNLPELICKSENNTFILVNYKNDKDTIINLKTDQVFNKSNCSLK